MNFTMKKWPRLGWLCVFLLIAGCATTETDPTKVSWGDLIRGDRLAAHLDARRQELKRLEAQSSALELRLLEKQDQLQSLNQKVQTARNLSNTANNELAGLNAEIETNQNELKQTLTKLQSLRAEEQGLRQSLATLNSDKRAMDEKLIRYELEIEQLESEVVVLENAIDRILLVRAKHALEKS